MTALFESYPVLARELPHVPLAELPTPVDRADELGRKLGVTDLYIKRDDLSGRQYGGNKIRKLEFLLADARKKGARGVMTFGCAGSNHATATAFYAKKLGLRSISMLLPQPNAYSVRKNLLLSFASGAELHHYESSTQVSLGVRIQSTRHRLLYGGAPYIIPAGGSSPLGVVGYVNAAFELHRQIREGRIPEPDLIYAAAGTTGTVAGLILGLRVLGLKTAVVPVRVTGEKFVNTERILELLREAGQLLHAADASFPETTFQESDVSIRHDFYGEQYALYTNESVEAVRLAGEAQGITLEGTYTGKAFAAMAHDAREGRLKGKTVLFWNTYNSRDFSELIKDIDYHRLPRTFHRYFEEDVQPLDRKSA